MSRKSISSTNCEQNQNDDNDKDAKMITFGTVSYLFLSIGNFSLPSFSHPRVSSRSCTVYFASSASWRKSRFHRRDKFFWEAKLKLNFLPSRMRNSQTKLRVFIKTAIKSLTLHFSLVLFVFIYQFYPQFLFLLLFLLFYFSFYCYYL